MTTQLTPRKPTLERGARPSLSAALKSLGERAGDAYARAASRVLRRIERLEDEHAARRYQRRAPNVTALPSSK